MKPFLYQVLHLARCTRKSDDKMYLENQHNYAAELHRRDNKSSFPGLNNKVLRYNLFARGRDECKLEEKSVRGKN